MKNMSDVNRNKDNIPDPDFSGFELRGPYIAVRPLEVEDRISTAKNATIYLPDEYMDTMKNAMCIGRVLKVSPAAHAEDIQGPIPLKVGDNVLYDKLATGRKVPFKDLDIIFMSADQVISTIEDPSQVYLANNMVRS